MVSIATLLSDESSERRLFFAAADFVFLVFVFLILPICAPLEKPVPTGCMSVARLSRTHAYRKILRFCLHNVNR
jgi:hypothetical protein